VARLRKKRKVSLRRERVKNYKTILNTLIVVNKGIILRTTTRNKNRIKELE
jgi:hypothetical protein